MPRMQRSNLPPGLSALVADALSDLSDDQPQRHPIDRRAQAMELVSRWERVHGTVVPTSRAGERDPLYPGDLCLEIEGVHRYRHAPLLIVWDRLRFWNWQHRLIVRDWHAKFNSVPLDVLVAELHFKAFTVTIIPHSRRMLRRYVPGEDDN